MAKYNQLVKYIYNHTLFDFFVFISLSSIITAQFLVIPARAFYSISMGVGLGLAVICYLVEFKSRKFDYSVFACFFVVGCVFLISSFLHKDFEANTIHDVRIKFQWFMMAFVFLFIKRIPKFYYFIIISVYIATILGISLYSAFPYSIQVLKQNQPIDFGRFLDSNGNIFKIIAHNLAMQCYFAICMLFFLSQNIKRNFILISIISFLILVLAYIIYITGARVGFLSLVLGAIIFLFSQIFKMNWRLVFIMLLLASVFSTMFYFLYKKSAIINYRVNHTVAEISFMYNEKLENWYPHGNFTVRILSNKYYIELYENNKLIGVSGPSDSKYHEALHKHYVEKGYWSWVHKLYPANQWVRYLIQIGLPLTILYFVALFLPLFFYFKRNFILVVMFVLGLFIYSNTETPLDPMVSFTIFSTTYPFFLLIADIFTVNNQKKEL